MFEFQLLQPSHPKPAATKQVKPKVAEPRRIPTPNDEQLEKLTILTDRAHSRAEERSKIHHEMGLIANETEATIAEYPYFDQTHINLLWDMDHELHRLEQRLMQLQAEEEMDAEEEMHIWEEVV
ncbi:hypothetical protein PEX1_005310 [Penicillium expansum]|uniref:Uncharacterized protein n=1 Tax=Penicillium expansum TaxID=27334 RepID=A0A0A2JTB5_PENEN|nr:hypothetical protein PEX2_049680 [Penicillium expansum]KGO48584.1 hypothetical protein PEXP_073140 [Penicillium expansum]KGO55480.1 hypothetical protein PEX2_049680 [Penicillium expansum]KGO61356.1 hypothetical protein PEX1_005310 [Penicillium expansum]